ncbi:LOW QUALITY PROTEIN: hypothetical protein PHMEG_00039996 [Phytophthora megakarya]|uniref:ATP-dependent DNA helicase n=1 Tax=Phytophthora megakarya TaxID=4795 RepID=A0A225UH38_9STRA|nr:LOW QUALITY PROTEIN: hypothetical protein PHMEG_00039996 [Phytophthora megakarya]
MSLLGGKPGAGKSQVIRALQALASSWKCSEAVGTVSYRGVAAQSVNGETIHKFYGWIFENAATGQREKMCKLKLLIMDEVSTTDAKIIGMIAVFVTFRMSRIYFSVASMYCLLGTGYNNYQ